MFLSFSRFYLRGVICFQVSVIFTCVVSYILKVRSFLHAWCHMFLMFGRFYLRGVMFLRYGHFYLSGVIYS